MEKVDSKLEAKNKVTEVRDVERLAVDAKKELERPSSFVKAGIERFTYDNWRSKGLDDRDSYKEGGEIVYSSIPLPPERLGVKDPSNHENGKEFYISDSTPSMVMNLIGTAFNATVDVPISFKRQLLRPIKAMEWQKWSPDEKSDYREKVNKALLILKGGLRQKYTSVDQALEDIEKVIPQIRNLMGDDFIARVEADIKIKLTSANFLIAKGAVKLISVI